jgi:hypothetical protein
MMVVAMIDGEVKMWIIVCAMAMVMVTVVVLIIVLSMVKL